MKRRLYLIIATVLAVACACDCSATTSSGPPTAQGTQDKGGLNGEPKVPATAAPGIELPPIPPADPRERLLATAMAHMLQREALTARPIDDKVAQQAMGYYVQHLDPGKQFLLQPQVEVLRSRANQLDDQLRSGDVELARLGSALLVEQRNKVAKMVAELTSQPFDLSNAETFESDPDKRSFPKDDAELKDLWRRSLERQVLERMERMRKALAAREEAKAGEDKTEKTEARSKPGQETQTHPGTDPGTAAGAESKTAQAEDDDEELPTTDEAREAKARADLATAYSGSFERRSTPGKLDAIETFLNAVAAVFGPHILYLAPDDKANFDIQMTGSLEGIGAVLSEGDHYIEVREIVPGGAAWRQGDLAAGDLILSVAQEGEEAVDVADMRINDVVRMIRGPKGTVVTLNVRKADSRLLTIVITRDEVVVEATYARGGLLRLDQKQAPVGYIYLPGFYGGGGDESRTATADTRALLQRFKQRNVTRAVLDLRGNGGGILAEATGVTGLFIDKGPVVQVRTADGEVHKLDDEDPGLLFDGALLVLVDRFSASASEIVAGALQDYGRALVVGTGPTHGKGTVQMLVDLDRMIEQSPLPLGVLKLTTQQFFLVDGESTQQRGVQPDLLLPDPLAYVESGERFLDNPVPWAKIAPLPHTPWSGPGWDVAKLAPKSHARIEESPVFRRLRSRAQYLKDRSEDTELPLQHAAWRARMEAQDKALDALELDEDDEPVLLSVEPVSYRAPRSAVQADPSATKATQERIERWRKQLERDPFVAEALHLFRDAAAQHP